MSSQYPNDGSSSPKFLLDSGLELLEEFNVNECLEDDIQVDGFGTYSSGQELMGDQDTGISNLIPAGESIQQSLATPPVEFGSNGFPVQNSYTASVGSSFCPNSFSPQNSLPGQLPPHQPCNYTYVGSSHCPGGFSAQNSLSGRHPPIQFSTANVGSSFPVQNSLPGHPLPNQSSTACVGSSYYPNIISLQTSLRSRGPPNQPSTANVGSSYQNSFSGLNSLPGQLPPRHPSTANARTSYCPDNFSAQNPLLGQLLPNQSSNYTYERTSYRQNSFSTQNSVPGQHPLNQPATVNVRSSYYSNSFSAQNSFPEQIPPIQPSTAYVGSSGPNNFSGQNSLPGLPNQPSTAYVGSSGPNNFSGQNSLPGLPNQPSTAYVGSSGPNNFSGQNSLPGLPNQSSTANVGRSRPNSFSGQTSFPGQLLAVPPSTANVRSSCPNSFSGQTSLPGQILHNYPYTENVGSSSSISFSAAQNSLPGQHLPNQTANIRSSGPNNSAAPNFSPRRGRPPGSRISRESARRSGPYNFTVGNFSPVHHLVSDRTTSTANIRISVQNNVSVENFLRIQRPTSGANIRSSNLNHARNILQGSENPNNFPVQNLPAQRRLNRTSSGDVIVRSSNPNPAGNNIQPQDLANFNSAGKNNFPGLVSRQISSGDVWNSNLNLAGNIQPNPLVGSNNFPGLVSSQISSGDEWISSNLNPPLRNNQPNPLASSNNFPGLVSSQISSGDEWSSNLNPSRNIPPNPLVGSNNFPGLVSSQTSSGDERSSNLNPEAKNIQPNPFVGSNNFPGVESSQISSGDVWSSNLNPAGNIQPYPLVDSNNFPVPAQDLPGGLQYSQVAGGDVWSSNLNPPGNDIQHNLANTLVAGSNTFPVPAQDLPAEHLLDRTSSLNPLPELPEQLLVPDHQTSGGNWSNINPADYIHPRRNLEVAAPSTHQNNTSTELMVPSDHAGNKVVGSLSGSNQPTGDQNTKTLQGDIPVQIGGGNNSRDGGPLLPPVKINSAGKREKSEEGPALAQGLSWIYSKKKPGSKRGYVDENCSDSFKRLCKLTGEKFLPNEYLDGLQGLFRCKKYPGENSGVEKNPGETNGSKKNSGGQTSGAPDKGKGIAYGQKKLSTQDRLDFHTNTISQGLLSLECEKEYERLKRIFASRTVPNQGTAGGESSVPANTSTVLPSPPSELGNSSFKGSQAPLVVIEGSWSNNVNTVTTETAVVPLLSSSSHHATAAAAAAGEVNQGSDNVNTVESVEVMVMETNDCVRVEEELTDAAAPEPEESWPEEFNKLIGYDQQED